MLDLGTAPRAEHDGQPAPLLRTILGDALRRTRLAQRRTLSDVAQAAKVSMPYLSEVERGRKEVSSEVLAAVCAALHIDLSDLLAEVWRGLAEFRARQARRDRVLRLGLATGRAAAPAGPAGPGESPADPRCLLAA